MKTYTQYSKNCPDQLKSQQETEPLLVDDLILNDNDDIVIEWLKLDSNKKPHIHLTCFGESFYLLQEWSGFFAELFARPDIQIKECIKLLEKHGFVEAIRNPIRQLS